MEKNNFFCFLVPTLLPKPEKISKRLKDKYQLSDSYKKAYFLKYATNKAIL